MGGTKNYKVGMVAEATSLGWLKGLGSAHGRRAWPYELHFPKSLATKHRSSPGQRPSTAFARFSQEREQVCMGTTAPSRRCAERPMRMRAQAAFPSPLPPKPRSQFQAGVTDAKGDGFLLKEKHRRRARGGPLSSRRSPGLRATRERRRRSRAEGGWGRSGKAGVGVGRGGSSGRPGSCLRNWSIRRSVSVQWGGPERNGGCPPDPRPSPALPKSSQL